jgi:hypothetical protein
MKIISFITEQGVIRAILDSVRRTPTPSTAGSLHPPPAARPAVDGVHGKANRRRSEGRERTSIVAHGARYARQYPLSIGGAQSACSASSRR